MSHFDALTVGFNCGVGVDLLRPAVESLAQISRKPIVCYPNAGLPDGMGGFVGIGRDGTAQMLGEFARNGWVNLVGGCCGTTPDWIAAIAREVEGVPPRRVPDLPALVVLQRQRGARRPARDELRHDRRALQHHRLAQVQTPHQGGQLRRRHHRSPASRSQSGANILDVNMDADLIDGKEAMTRFLHLLANEPDLAKVPIMIDSSKWEIIEAGLKCLQGKGIVNSISLKEGEEKFLEQARLVKRYGAAVVVMAFRRRT